MKPEEILPLTPMQDAMLVHELASPASGVLQSQVRLRLDGQLDVEAFDRAWCHVVRRHGMLRAAVLSDGLKQPVQVVHPEVAFGCRIEDWRRDPPAARAARHEAFLEQDRLTALDLTRPPLMRVSIVRLADDLAEVVWTSHHLVTDHACVGLVLGEVAQFYDGVMTGRPPMLAEPGRFRDYLAWLQRRDTRRTETFWRDELSGLADLTRLPNRPDRAEGPPSISAGWRIGPEVTAALRQFARRHRITLNTIVLGAWAIQVGRLGGGHRGLLGVTFAGRPVEVAGAERTVGSFITNLPVRVEFQPDRPIVEWLRALQARLLAVQEHADVPPARLHALAALPGNVPLLETLFVCQPAVRLPEFASGLRWKAVGGKFTTAIPLALSVSEAPESIGLVVVASARRADARQLAELLERLGADLARLGQDTEVSVFGLLGGDRAGPPASAVAPPEQPGHGTDGVAIPADGVEARLIRVWSQVLGVHRPTLDESFFDAGGTSIQAIELVERIRAEFDRKVPLAAVVRAPTVHGMARLLRDATAPTRWSCLVPVQPGGTATPFFAVHHGGGGIFGYGLLARYLGHEQPLYGLQEPGLELGEEPPTSIEALAGLYVDEIRSVQPRGPYVVGGFCFGGLVAFEMAQQLTRAGERVDTVIVIDGLAPALRVPSPLSERLAWHASQMARRSVFGRSAYLAGRIVRRARWEVVGRLMQGWTLGRLGLYHTLRRLGIPEPAALRQFHLLQHNGRLSTAYAPQPYAGRVVLVRSDQPQMAFDFHWNRVVARGVEVYPMPTDDHLAMLTEPHVRTLAGHLMQVLRGAARDHVAAS